LHQKPSDRNGIVRDKLSDETGAAKCCRRGEVLEGRRIDRLTSADVSAARATDPRSADHPPERRVGVLTPYRKASLGRSPT
jgi:hypothetical protein